MKLAEAARIFGCLRAVLDDMEEYAEAGMRGIAPRWARASYRSIRRWCLSFGLRSSGDFFLSAEERKASATMSVVIAVHDSPEVTERCLKSLERFGGESEIIIVDDGSQLQSTRCLLEEFSSRNGWRLIRNERAVGHSRASEAGVNTATRPYACLLNSDTVVTPRSWEGIVAAFDRSPKIAVVGPSTSQTVTAQVVPRAMYCRHDWSDEQIWDFGARYVDRHRDEELTDLPRVGGFAFFVRRTVWGELGGFDKNLPDYGNETEFCRRVLRLDLRVVWSKASYVHHLGSESYGRTLGLAEILRRGSEADAYVEKKVTH